MSEISIGRVVGKSAYEVAVANGFQGTEQEWLDSLKGKDGDGSNVDLSAYYTREEVDTLIAGVEGSEGPAGPVGAEGKSAYEAALGNGFEGTETEWLESLKGADGRDGKNGADGYTPVKGTDYFDGEQGPQGEAGKDAELVNVKDNSPISFWLGTKAEYDAIAEKDLSVIYHVIGEEENGLLLWS